MQNEVQPGIYPSMPNEFYHGAAGLSKSGLALLRECPAKYAHRYLMGNKEEETQAMKIGDALHCLVLEPSRFPLQFAVSQKFDGRTKEGKAGKAEFAAANAGKSIITVDDYALIEAMATSVHSHPAAAYLLSLGGLSEESFFWEEMCDPTESQILQPVLCKCRPDLRVPSKRILVDLKKTAKGASAEAFSRTIYNYTYHLQAAHYLHGVTTISGEQYDEFIFIAVEEEPPHLVAVYQLDQDSIMMGRAEIDRLVDLYAKCLFHQYWPGYGESIQLINLPRWAKQAEVVSYE